MAELPAMAGLPSLAAHLGLKSLTVQQERAVTLLMRGQPYNVVAQAVGCSATTVAKWMEEGHPLRTMFDYMRNEQTAWTMDEARVDRNLLTQMLFEAHRKAATATEEISAIRELGKMHGLYESDKKTQTGVTINITSTDQLRRASTEKLLELVGVDAGDLIPLPRQGAVFDAEECDDAAV